MENFNLQYVLLSLAGDITFQFSLCKFFRKIRVDKYIKTHPTAAKDLILPENKTYQFKNLFRTTFFTQFRRTTDIPTRALGRNLSFIKEE